MSKEKRYTIQVTYETELVTHLTPDEIEEGIWVGDHEIGRYSIQLGNFILRADAVGVEIELEE